MTTEIVRPAQVQADGLIVFNGRPLRIIKAMGADPSAPVILEELAAGPTWMAGQFTIWAAAAVERVQRAMLELA